MNSRWIFSLTAVGWLLAGSVLADQVASTENPYTPIVTRNMFDLVPVPVGPPPDPTPSTPPPKITPNGIMTIFGKLQALFKVAGVAKPGQPAKDESYILGEGERQDNIEVQKIDEKAAIITFNNHGKIEELPLVAGTAVGGELAPAVPNTPGVLPRPGIVPPAGGNPPPIGFGGRFGRNVGNENPSAGGAPGFGGGTSVSAGNAASSEQLSPEAQVIMMETQRAQWLKQGNPAAAIIPPTPITQQVIGGGSENSGPPAPGGPPAP
jgi:hypothetical protein